MISFPDPGWQLLVHGVANAVLDRHHGLHVSKLGQASRLLKTLEGLPGGRGHSCTRIMGHNGNCHFHLTRKTRGIEYLLFCSLLWQNPVGQLLSHALLAIHCLWIFFTQLNQVQYNFLLMCMGDLKQNETQGETKCCVVR